MSISNENSDKKEKIPYNYENAKNNVYNTSNIDNSNSSEDVMLKINEEADKLNENIDKSSIKLFSKYEDLEEEKLLELVQEKDENLLKLNAKKEKSIKALNAINKKLGKVLSENADLLFKTDSDQDTIKELEQLIESKKKSLKVSKNLNHTFKSQYNYIKNKQSDSKYGENLEPQLTNLKNENQNLQIQIKKLKENNAIKQKQTEIISENKTYLQKIQSQSEEIKNLSSLKYEYLQKVENSMRSLENLIKESNRLEELKNSVNNPQKKQEMENSKVLFWANIIKNDLSGTNDEILSRIAKNQSNFIIEIDKKQKNSSNDEKLVVRARSSSPTPDKQERYKPNLKKTITNNNTLQTEINNNNIYSGNKIINKGKNAQLILKYNNNNLDLKTENNIANNTNRTSNNTNNKNYKITEEKDECINPKSIFNKFKYLKKKPGSSSEKTRDKKLNNSNAILEKEKMINKDYNETNDSDYRELLDKKCQYLDTILRLENNIKECMKTKAKKISLVEKAIQENSVKLELLKSKNDILNTEIENLNKVYALTIERERVKKEMKEKNEPQKKIKTENSSLTEKIILNALKESNESLPKINDNKNENNKEDIKSDEKQIIKRKTEKNKSGYYNEDKDETREQKLQKIKEKYMEMNDDCIDESDAIEDEQN